LEIESIPDPEDIYCRPGGESGSFGFFMLSAGEGCFVDDL
jgi:hypothetical protein